MSNKIWLRCKR